MGGVGLTWAGHGDVWGGGGVIQLTSICWSLGIPARSSIPRLRPPIHLRYIYETPFKPLFAGDCKIWLLADYNKYHTKEYF